MTCYAKTYKRHVVNSLIVVGLSNSFKIIHLFHDKPVYIFLIIPLLSVSLVAVQLITDQLLSDNDLGGGVSSRYASFAINIKFARLRMRLHVTRVFYICARHGFASKTCFLSLFLGVGTSYIYRSIIIETPKRVVFASQQAKHAVQSPQLTCTLLSQYDNIMVAVYIH